jgi:phenylalanyl-tRNA synthetase beta chain
MLVSLNWLRELVDIPVDIETFAKRLTDTGTEVEGIEEPVPLFRGALTAKVDTIEIHPSRQDLFVLGIDASGGRRAVCITAARNLREGDIVPWGPPGSILANGTEITTRDFEGVISEGMVLSAEEIGLPEIADEFGILRLDPGTPPGEDVRKALGLDDAILEISITPNRGDLLSMVGIAREVAAVFPEAALKPLAPVIPPRAESLEAFRGITLDDPDCPYYALGAIDNVQIKPSPVTARVRLLLSGMRPISNVVDATNLVMLLIGQPLHAFDSAGLPDSEITVRSARKGEMILTLDGKTRILEEADLLITSGGKPIGLAGVMGGEESEISGSTSRVLLESANFQSIRISRTSRKLGLPSEAAYRFARFVDPFKVEPALAIAMDLMVSWGAGVFGGWIASGDPGCATRKVTLSSGLLEKIISTGDLDMATTILRRLGITTADTDPLKRVYEIPSARPDISIEEDLVEEVARIRGYDLIKPALPPVLHSTGDITDRMRAERAVRSTAMARGYSEVITYSFVSPASISALRFPDTDIRSRPVALSNPLSVDISVLRTTLIPGLVQAALKNIRSGWRGPIRMIETGMVFIGKGEEVEEILKMGGCVCPGMDTRSPWGEQAVDDLHSVASDVMAIFASRGKTLKLVPGSEPFGHSGKTARAIVDGYDTGYLLELKPEIESEFELPSAMYLFELDMEPLIRGGNAVFGEVRKYPPVYRDISLIAEEGVCASDILELIRGLAGPFLENVRLFDVYTGKGIPEGKRSLAFSLAYRDPEKTLRDEDVDRTHGRLRELLMEKGIKLR